MTAPFFITGLPQSRTAWLANLFTTGKVFCHHDLLAEVDGLDMFCQTIAADLTRGPAGDSDSGLLSAYVPLCNRYPEAKWVLVQRDFEDAWNSLCAFLASGPWWDVVPCTWEVREEMRKQWELITPLMISNPRCMVVPFESLERTDMIETIWKHCVPGQRWDGRRAAALQKLQVRPFQTKCNVRPAFKLVKELCPTGLPSLPQS